LYEQDAVFGIFRLAFGGFAEGSGSGVEITRLQSEQAKIERLIVLIGIKIGGAAKFRLGLGRLPRRAWATARLFKISGRSAPDAPACCSPLELPPKEFCRDVKTSSARSG